MRSKSILILAGEASGDHHAAALVRDLKDRDPYLRITGIGGEKLADAGMRLLHHYHEINTIALTEGLGKVRNIFAAYNTMKRELAHGGHDLFIPVDFPDVNIRLCRKARQAGVPVCYYISPQVWAWRRGRIRKIGRRVDRMMTIFPFEERLYREAGINADFVGHTMVRDIPETLDRTEVRKEFGLDGLSHVVALVPGSRPAEIRRMLPVMCRAAKYFSESFPEAGFVLPLAGPHLQGLVGEILKSHEISVAVLSAEAPRVMAAADNGLITSGTATLQATLVGMPHVLVYKVDPFTWWLGLKVIKPLLMAQDVHLGIANVLAIEEEKIGGPIGELTEAGITIPCQECGRPLLVPEVLQEAATPENLAQWLIRFITDDTLRRATLKGYQQIRSMLLPRHDGQTAARVVLNMLAESNAPEAGSG